MTYWLLCCAACLATFAVVAASIAGLRWAAEPVMSRLLRRGTNKARANGAFLLRILPAGGAVVATCGLALPAFLVLEPAATQERVSFGLAALAALGFAFSVVMIIGTAQRVIAGSLLARQWRSCARRRIIAGKDVAAYEVDLPGALVATIGIFRPDVFVSSAVVETLSPEELAAAISHETSHISAFDNLKRLLMRAVSMPLDRKNNEEQLWTAASELAADECAVAHGTPPLELASALIKVARLLAAPIPSAASVSCFVPYETRSTISERIKHLLKLSSEPRPEPSRRHALLLASSIFAIAAFVFAQPRVLELAHEFTEKLVR